MINLSVQRKVDDFKRIAIPKKACQKLNWKKGTNLFCLQMKNDNKLYIFLNMEDFIKFKDFKIDNVLILQTRKLDILNRIVIPREIYDDLKFCSGKKVSIKQIDNYVTAENI